MAIRTIVKIGDPLLKEISKEVTQFDSRLGVLLDDMKETMEREDGVGLAAVQVGVLKRACIICPDHDEIYELINPVIIKEEGSQLFNEGCLSVPNVHSEVKRPKSITVKAQDRLGNPLTIEAKDYLAVIFCHEIDHLNGILFTDRRPQ